MSEHVEASPMTEPFPAPTDRAPGEIKESHGSALWREVKGMSLVILAVLGFHSFIAKPFYIPSESMMPVLLKGDRLVVTKYAYGWSFVSPTIPNPAAIVRTLVLRGPAEPWGVTLPFMHGRLFGKMPARGDIVIVTPPGANEDYIKRVIGLPGDTIAYRDNTVYVNGQPLGYTSIGRYVGRGQGVEATGAFLLTEALPGRPHPVLERDDRPFFIQGEGEWTVPAGHYFVMGDNRDNSEDSRFWGFLPEANLRGKAFLVWMHWDGSAGGVDFNRIGSRIP